MAIVKCEAGLHYYDNEKYGKCPHCGVKLVNSGDFGVAEYRHMNDEKTVAYAEPVGSEEQMTIMQNVKISYDLGKADDERTVAYHSAAKGNDYVTGWLVCIEGPEKGRDYRIHHGFNKVGRGSDMDIIIVEDTYISRGAQCQVVYDDRHNKFYLSPAGGNIAYINDELLTKSVQLDDGDIIHIGRSSFEFVPFCRENRKWGD